MRAIGSILLAILFLIVFAIFVKTALYQWILETFAYPRYCKEIAPNVYKYSIYNICNLQKYNLTPNDLLIKTEWDPTTGTCKATLYIEGKEVYHFEFSKKRSAVILCKDIIEAWQST